MSDRPTFAATILVNFAIVRLPTLEQGYRAFFDRVEGVDQTGGGHTSSAVTPKPRSVLRDVGMGVVRSWEYRGISGAQYHVVIQFQVVSQLYGWFACQN